MSKFDRSKVKEIHKDIVDALNQIAKKHGMHSLGTGTLSFNDSKFTVRVTGIAAVDTSDVTVVPATSTSSNPFMNRVFMSTSGKKFTVCDYKPQNHKYPIIANNENGTRYKFTIDQVKRGLI